MIDRSTKLLLAVIALALLANAVTPLLRPAAVAAAPGPMNCTGDLRESSGHTSNGSGTDVVTGWAISVQCR